jgi:hypothetical protein
MPFGWTSKNWKIGVSFRPLRVQKVLVSLSQLSGVSWNLKVCFSFPGSRNQARQRSRWSESEVRTCRKGGGSQTPVAHICNPSYLGGRDQKDRGSKSAWTNSLQHPISEIHNTKRADRVVASMKPWVQTPGLPKKKKEQSRVSESCWARWGTTSNLGAKGR